MGGGVNRGLYDYKANSGLDGWAFYLDGGNNILIQGKNEITLRALKSNILTIKLSALYRNSTNTWSTDKTFIKIYNQHKNQGNDLVV
jgi:hypothetical protein